MLGTAWRSGMPDPYPLPAYAVSIWISGDDLMVAFPGTVTEQGHTIRLPASAGGLQAAVNRLSEAVATARQPGKPLSTISAITREAPLASLFVAFLFGIAVARRR